MRVVQNNFFDQEKYSIVSDAVMELKQAVRLDPHLNCSAALIEGTMGDCGGDYRKNFLASNDDSDEDDYVGTNMNLLFVTCAADLDVDYTVRLFEPRRHLRPEGGGRPVAGQWCNLTKCMIAKGGFDEGRIMYGTLNTNGTTSMLQCLDTLAYAITNTEAFLGSSDWEPLPVNITDPEFQN